MKIQEQMCDVLIVGSGGAALRAAIAAKDRAPKLRVCVATKGELGKSGVTATACSDRMAFHATLPTTEPGGADAWKHHADDIYRIGGYVSDADLAQVLAKNAASAFADLDKWGVPFARRADGVVDQFVTDGSKYARACYTGPYTANHIEAALVAQIKQRDIALLENTLVADLLFSWDRSRVSGAVTINEKSGELGMIRCKAVVLATGGAGQVFAVNVFSPDVTGDGYAMAFRAGAELVNMEFIQIGLSSVKTKLACSGDMMRALPKMVNSEGREFLADYFPKKATRVQMYNILFAKGASWPVSYQEPSHIIDIAVAYELAAGRKVYLDYGSNPSGLKVALLDDKIKAWYQDKKQVNLSKPALSKSPLARLQAINPQIIKWLEERGIDLKKGETVELAPAIQHFQGGIKIRTHAETTIKGLYAAGEAAGGQHGANRPGGNALMDSQVFGKIAGESAADDAAALGSWPVMDGNSRKQAMAWVAQLQNGGAPLSATELRQKVQEIMSDVCGVVRVRARVIEAIEQMEEWQRKGCNADEKGLAYAVETMNIITVARLVASGVRARTESRGPHLMFNNLGDLQPMGPDDEHWRQYVVIKNENDRISYTERKPVEP